MTSCSQAALEVGEPLPGTTPVALTWLIIEQPGPWGHDALVDSHLDPALGASLSTWKAQGLRVLLARHPDRPERTRPGARHVWVARAAAGGMLMRRGMIRDADELASWDLAEAASGSLPPFGSVVREPSLFVCTHSGRDRCCALHGRSLVTSLLAGLSAPDRDRVWECSHVGGHRFAPVALTLPSGTVHGRLDAATGREVWDRLASGEVVVDRLRGRSCFPAPHQVAAIEVQRVVGIAAADDLDVLAVRDGRVVPVPATTPIDPASPIWAEVRHRDGRAWRAHLVWEPLDGPRPESCGKEALLGGSWTCVDLRTAPDWGG